MKLVTSVMLMFLAALTAFAQQGTRESSVALSPGEIPEVGTVAVGPFTLRYRIEGSGPPALIVGSSQYYPRVFSSALRRSLRLVFLDQRGFAPPPAHPVDTSAYALDVLLDDIERAREQLKLGRVIVMGHSGNAYLALEYAKKYPQHVSHAVMIAISPDLSAANSRAQAEYFKTAASPERKEALAKSRAQFPKSEMDKRSPGQRYIDTYIRETPRIWYDLEFDVRPIWADLKVNVDMTDYVWGQVFRDIDITKGLARFERPVLLLLGRHDYLLPAPSIWDPLAPKFRDLTIRIFEKSGHTPQYEEAAAFDTALLKWLRSRP